MTVPGILQDTNSSYRSFDEFAFHLHTNTIGPIIVAQKLLQTYIPIGTIVFMSSDSGSQGDFREHEDGFVDLIAIYGQRIITANRFAAYAASKSALNMAIRVCEISASDQYLLTMSAYGV